MRPAAAAAVVVVTLGLAGLGGCAKTTYDSTITTAPVGAAPASTTTTLPTGDATTLLPRMVEEAGTLSRLITTKSDPTAAAQQIAALWNASKQEVGRKRPELLGDFEANVARCAAAARFTRAADADKAYRNLRALVAAYLG